MWRGRGMGFWGLGLGFGRGPNLMFNCRRFPWLPRWWWANPAYSQNLYAQSIPSVPSDFNYIPTMPTVPTMTKDQEKQILEGQLGYLQKQIEFMKQRIIELEK